MNPIRWIPNSQPKILDNPNPIILFYFGYGFNFCTRKNLDMDLAMAISDLISKTRPNRKPEKKIRYPKYDLNSIRT